MAIGIVKWYNETKGFGFIMPEDKGPEIFVHCSHLPDNGRGSLSEGLKVEYDLAPVSKALHASGQVQATNIRVVK
ncbi:cold shock domain-containing protein [Pseudomonas sp.]|uniref:cold-shock protein n=1 Tax=Pseudomonas sp. TaxID=306 RepID=UPI0026133790|nr:cold shock domain-containing protein [Pseudomonas sp.]